jgi:hypothetical protein
MQEINHRPPDSMTVTERMDEVAVLLARGVSRVWDASVAKSANVARQSHLGLGFRTHQSVHSDPSNEVTESE